ncbi:bifunctional hydroxymethylpyrimidine kinase/phosphomethylpyrimidine kinase [Zunongwangia endophytica]|uniref:hydroxymethylpyrimidine kinase n=1 Tax=Zunongwangia endophytica TaxID=1808945 RepID=A0ABV8HB10_9FLAO|nr:bifunctional hydroxymethylpyrimidine kinase/phosphomethylpyrimidine kinase [Zunongwangia endophytica]MDN3593746.1 bifunctional hydroxymethylpyrimidine kinase/phosphomethylpyrimidine kinase [Zunongwangia endophytica]
MKTYKYPSALTIAGFDGSGGAGIQADIKTFSALGCYATSVLTALPVQNTTGVKNIFPISYQAVSEQIDSIFDDIFPDAVKIGMVHTPELVKTIVAALQKYPKTALVFDPVMVATSGHKLIEDETVKMIIEQLFPLADVITPNMDEAAVLAEMKVETLEDMKKAGEKIMKLGCKSVLMKGGHLKSDRITSLYFAENGEIHSYEFKRFDTNNTHGSGCTLSSAIASFLARGENLIDAIKLGQDFAHQAIENGKDVKTGEGNGPLNHFYNPQKLIKNELE